MRVDPQRAHVLAENVGSVLQKISGAASGRKVSEVVHAVWLLAAEARTQAC